MEEVTATPNTPTHLMGSQQRFLAPQTARCTSLTPVFLGFGDLQLPKLITSQRGITVRSAGLPRFES